jgi:hypothetical protein
LERAAVPLTIKLSLVYLLSSHVFDRKAHGFDTLYFQHHEEPRMGYLEVDSHVVGRLADVVVYTAQALMAMFVSAQVPFELEGMGSNTLGVFVCQWGFIAVVWNGSFFDSLAHMSNDKHLGENLFSGSLQVRRNTLAPFRMSIALTKRASSAPWSWTPSLHRSFSSAWSCAGVG